MTVTIVDLLYDAYAVLLNYVGNGNDGTCDRSWSTKLLEKG